MADSDRKEPRGSKKGASLEKRDILERRLLVLLEVEAERAKRPNRSGCFRATRAVNSSASPVVTRPISRAVTSARTRLSRSSARRKIVRGWPCEVDVAPLRGRGASRVSAVTKTGGGRRPTSV